MDWFRSRWNTFVYNYQWSDYVTYIDGWIPKLALTVPLLGYLILFNDKVSEVLVFKQLAAEMADAFGLSGVQRLRSLYFGLVLLGISNLIYRVRRPYAFRFGSNFVDYSRTCLEVFTLGDYISMHGTIRHEGHLTPRGKYYDSEWDGFVGTASNTDEGRSSVKRDGNWEEAKRTYGGLLRDILYETFFRFDRSRRFALTTCLVLTTSGYALLLIPSADLFLKVLLTSIF